MPLSQFTAGELWLEHPQGDTRLDSLRGRLLPIAAPCVSFDPRTRHATMPWSGTRVVLIAFHIRQAWRLPVAMARSLEHAGFSLCTSDVETDPYLRGPR